MIRDFNGLPKWHPAIAEVADRGQLAGRPRRLHPQFPRCATAAQIREQLLALSDYDYQLHLLDPRNRRWASTNYIATLKLTPITDGNRTSAEWSAEFDSPPGARSASWPSSIGQGVFQGGFDALKSQFGHR